MSGSKKVDRKPPATPTAAPQRSTRTSSQNRKLYRITDLDAWRGDNKAESFLFPNYEDDSATPEINRVLLLDRGDWVPYHKGQPVKINVMDRDERGVRALVIKRGDKVVEEIKQPGKGVVERSFRLRRLHRPLRDEGWIAEPGLRVRRSGLDFTVRASRCRWGFMGDPTHLRQHECDHRLLEQRS